ncbi:MAG: MMPL family transporter, partial [Planctomycetales bacterium]|nr:MMPL family transporter [Planctomycetales bacterium]
EKIGKFTAKYRYPVILFWVALLVTITILAPDLGDVASSDQAGFLGDDELSVKATEILAKYFPEQAPPSAAALVVESQNGSLRDEAAQAYLADLSDWLQRDLAPGLVTQVFSPADPALADQLISQDGQAGFFMVGFGSSYGDPVADAIETTR